MAMDAPAGTFSASEMMTVVAARALRNRDVCFVGIGAPSAACNLARLTHAPEITLIYESGTIGARPTVLPLSIGDGELCETALTTVSVPEMFRYWLQGGRITVGFLSGAQMDRHANLNTTVVGEYRKPKVRLPGGDTAYALPELPSHQVAPEDHLRRVLGEWVVEADYSANLIVLRTPPGSAHVVGSALDRSGFPGVIGTVAGDDTVLVVASEAFGGAAVAERLAAVAGIEPGWAADGPARPAGRSGAPAAGPKKNRSRARG